MKTLQEFLDNGSSVDDWYNYRMSLREERDLTNSPAQVRMAVQSITEEE